MTHASDDKRFDGLVDLIVQLGSGNLSARLAASDAGDSVDAVITGVNLFAEELDRVRRTLEQGPRTGAHDRADVADIAAGRPA